jgi:hypothetical protein
MARFYDLHLCTRHVYIAFICAHDTFLLPSFVHMTRFYDLHLRSSQKIRKVCIFVLIGSEKPTGPKQYIQIGYGPLFMEEGGYIEILLKLSLHARNL